jgi:amino acid adenylation domain-containing protein
LAKYLEETGVANNSPIPIYCEASIEFLISMIAVFKAGGTYIPIDVNFPIERLNDILEDSGAQILISKTSLISDLTRNSKFTSNTKLNYIVNLDNNGTDEYFNNTMPIVNIDTIEKFSKNKIEYKSSPEDLSYMIYTSGTTGKPKGVMIHHLGMLNHLYAKSNDLSITKLDIVAQTASISFDISVWQFLAALIVGGKIHIIEKEITLQPVKYLKTLQQGNITILESVPSLMTVFLDITKNISNKSLKTLRWMIPTGEALSVSLVRKWYESYPKIKLLNAYGPTEASDDITHYIVEEVPDKHATSIPIGKPIQNMHLYILNDHLNLCPVGVIGEICVSGIGVGKGYWKDIKKTEKAFIKNPYYKQIGDNKHSIVYKTGDLGYFREDGNIECLGRKDYQVKINGYRIELGEIESQLAGHHQIKDTAVIVKEKEGNKYIVAYYASEKEIEVTGLREYLSKQLPDYMIPTYYVYLTSLPLTHNGKINKKALPEPEIKAGENYKPPSNEIEERLVEIWSEVLAVDKDTISINSNFFEIGGHSINLLRVHSMINEEFKSNISVANMFSLSNIYALADFITNGNRKINELEEGLDEREEALSFLGENR